ncbi:hypothetical protein IQ210_08800 [Streptomyces sp. 3R004]|nr:hypothetical protein [Streptomyces justiciae]
MTFILTGQDDLSPALDEAGDSAQRLQRRLNDMSKNGSASVSELVKVTKLLAPAAIPAAASLAPIAAGAGAVAAAALAMGAALVPQVAALGEASDAQKAYEDAVATSGRTSQAAVTAQAEYARVMAALPPKTREAAVAVGILKDEYQAWSDSLAGDTMAPFIKGVQITNALVPKTTGLVKAASTEADRFMTILGGEIESPGLDSLNSKFTTFAKTTLRSVNDGFVHLLRVSDGKVGGPASEFMEWARAQGPTVSSVLRSVATALVHILDAGSGVGVSLLDTVDAVASLVAAVPPGAIAAFLQLALALKVTKAAALGLAAGRAALAVFATQLVTMRAAAAGAPGTLAGVTAAIGTLSRTAKIAIAGTGIGLLVMAISELSSMGESAPPDVDRLTTSLGNLGRTGKVTGYAAQEFGADFGKLHDQISKVTNPSVVESINNWGADITGGFLDAGDATEEFTKSAGSIDEALTNLVRNGNAQLAKAALADMLKGLKPEDAEKFRGELDKYDQALADLAFEQKLTAQSQGLFGAEAQKVQAKLDAQKQSADGLRQSIQALNDIQRTGLGAMNAFEQSIDDTSKAARENAGALSMSHGELDLNSAKARAAESALRDLAGKTDAATAAAREQGKSWEYVNGIYSRGREEFIKSAQAMGLTKKEAAQLADQILQIPDKTTLLKGDVTDLDDKITKAQERVDALKQKRKTAVGADKTDLDKKVAAAQAKVDSLKQKKLVALQAADKSTSVVQAIQRAISKLRDKTVNIYTVQHTLGVEGTAGRNSAKYNGYAGGGNPVAGEIAMVGEEGPELVLFGKAAKVFDAKTTAGMLNGSSSAGQAAAQGLAAGLGSTAGVYVAARAMAGSVLTGIRDELEIRSPSKKTEALMKDVGKGMIKGLTGTRDQIKATAKDLAADIWKAFTGKKDNQLVAMVNKQTKKLLDLAAKRDKIAAKIAEAKEFAKDTTKSARESAGLANLGMEPGEVTAGGIKAGLAGKLAQIKQFTRYIDILAKRGLNKSLLRQILNMGPEAGYAYASALVGADKATFASINSLQKQLDSTTTTLGKKGADALYDSGKNASKGFLAGLESQEKEIEKLMEKIALSMQKALKKALGISSPAKKMIPDGINTARGVAVGVLAGMPFIDSAMDAVAGRMAGRAATAPVAGRAAVARTSSSDAAPITVIINGPIDAVSTAQELERILLKYKRGGGGLGYGFG